MNHATHDFLEQLQKRHPEQPQFLQAVTEVIHDVMPLIESHAHYQNQNLLACLVEPDRAIQFKVSWQDDQNQIQVNRGYRVQFNNAIGAYKGGLRFHPNTTLDTFKFLGFEQIFKNSLTGLPMGGAKGGSDFNPKGKSDGEVMRFCQAFMSELYQYIGPNTDVPAGDIGVGAREIGYLFGTYKKLTHRFDSVLTGKGLSYGGSLGRKQATGHGCVYFLNNMLGGQGLEGKTALVSGSGNVALYAIDKLIELGAKVVTASDSGGTIHDADGIDADKLNWLVELKEQRRGRISEYAEHFKCDYHEGKTPWHIPADLALPCATQNELNEQDANTLIKNQVQAMAEGANMPCTLEATQTLQQAGVLLGPSKAANAGGVAVSGLEQSQNAQRLVWSAKDVDAHLQTTMNNIHSQCLEHGQTDAGINYTQGANRAGFIKVADAMLAQGMM